MTKHLDELRAVVAAHAAGAARRWPPTSRRCATRAYTVTDADVERLLAAGCTEDEIFEQTVAAAISRGPAPARRGAAGDRMRLAVVDHGHAPDEAAMLAMIRERSGAEPLGVVKTLLYRPELFGTPVLGGARRVMRGPSEWSAGERELFAGFTSLLNQCPF